MKLFAVASGEISEGDLRLFEQISAVVKSMPDIVFDAADSGYKGVTCHQLCRALAQVFKVKVHDGYFNAWWRTDHSWLTTSTNRSIIDPYPVGLTAPIICDRWVWQKLYEESNEYKERISGEEFDRRVEVVARAVKSTASMLGHKAIA